MQTLSRSMRRSNDGPATAASLQKTRTGAVVPEALALAMFSAEQSFFAMEGVLLLDEEHGDQTGTVYITNYRLFFWPQNQQADRATLSGEYEAGAHDSIFVSLPLGHIHKLEKKKDKGAVTDRGLRVLDVHCKVPRFLRFGFRAGTRTRGLTTDVLTERAFFDSQTELFAFSYRIDAAPAYDGWKVYSAVDEFKRLGLPNAQWRLTNANQQYLLCDSYPPLLCVPSTMSDSELSAVAGFRSKGRFPALAWKHPTMSAVITRCSQPLVGLKRTRSAEDEGLITAIVQANGVFPHLLVMDARPRANAVGNSVKGAGYENTDFYSNCKLFFLKIDNIHAVRDSHNKLVNLCSNPVTAEDRNWLTALDATNWLYYIKMVLQGSVQIVSAIESKNASVLIHCSDGWDRTAQLSSLAQLMLDPHYRTITGFQILVEKEWCDFGHKFGERSGHGSKNHGDTQRSPIFVQFIDCVWQIMQQYPCSFEFNELFLLTVIEHLYSNCFGTFLFNNRRERELAGVRQTTTSLWTYINLNREHFRNSFFRARSKTLYPNTSSKRLKVFLPYFCKQTSELWRTETREAATAEIAHELIQLRQQLRAMQGMQQQV